MGYIFSTFLWVESSALGLTHCTFQRGVYVWGQWGAGGASQRVSIFLLCAEPILQFIVGWSNSVPWFTDTIRRWYWTRWSLKGRSVKSATVQSMGSEQQRRDNVKRSCRRRRNEEARTRGGWSHRGRSNKGRHQGCTGSLCSYQTISASLILPQAAGCNSPRAARTHVSAREAFSLFFNQLSQDFNVIYQEGFSLFLN